MGNKLNIVLFAPSIHTGGGTERVLINLANALNARGYCITIVVKTKGKKQLFNLNKNITVKSYWFGNIRDQYPNSFILKVLNKFIGNILLKQFLKPNTISNNDLIISFSNGITIECYEAGFKNNLIAYEHWPYWISEKNLKLRQKIHSIYPRLIKIILLTNHEKNVYNAIGCDNIKVIPNAYSFLPEEPAKLEQKVVLSVGHFNEQKRRDLLVKAWKNVNKKHPDWKLVIVGDGFQKEEAINLAKRLHIYDSIEVINPNPNIEDYYSKCSIFVLSSEFESFSLVLQEAKTFGIPCVSFNVAAGPSEVLQDEKDGFLVSFPDTNEMANKINILIENISLRKRFGKEARQDALERFSPEKIYDTWVDLITHLTNK